MAEMELKKIIGKRIMLARREHDLTQTELAERVGVTQNAISTWELGRGRIDAISFLRICSVLNKPHEWFLTPFDQPNVDTFAPLAPLALAPQLMPTT